MHACDKACALSSDPTVLVWNRHFSRSNIYYVSSFISKSLYVWSCAWVVTVPATCWGFIGPVFIRKGSPPSNARMGSVTSPLCCWLVLLFFSWMISSKSAPLALETPFWCAVSWTPFTTGPDTLCAGLRTAAPGLCRFSGAAEKSKTWKRHPRGWNPSQELKVAVPLLSSVSLPLTCAETLTSFCDYGGTKRVLLFLRDKRIFSFYSSV